MISIFDTTLRDGEQAPGISYTRDQKVSIAKQLVKLGVDVIEAGTPVVSEEEKDVATEIAQLDTKVAGLARITEPDINACVDADVDMIHVFVPTSDIQAKRILKYDKDEIIARTVDSIEHVKDHGIECLFSAMDATRTEEGYLKQILKASERAGADYINIPDTVGIMVPSAMHKLVKSICETVNIPVSVHCHNDFGLAVANSLASVEAGADMVQVTVNGIGERAGNASLAEVVMALNSIYDLRTNIKTERLLETTKLVERFTGIRIAPNQPIVGENAFSHESGIHVHGIIQSSDTFEPAIMTPEMVGHHRRITLGKHTGKHGILEKLRASNLHPTEDELRDIIERVKDLSSKGKQITDVDLYKIAEIVMGEVARHERAIQLDEVSVMTGNKSSPTAVVRGKVLGKEKLGTSIGVGPVDAALKAIQTMVDIPIKLTNFKIDSITGGSDALAEVTVGVSDEKGNFISARGVSEDIVMASVEALTSSINRLIHQPK